MSHERPVESHWPEMLRLMQSQGADAVVAYVQGFDDPTTRRQLFARAQQGFGGGPWEGRDLDAITTVVEAGIAEGIAQAAAATDEAQRAELTDYANVLSYNLSAALADCWPDDDLPRESRHLAAGLRAADQCLAWRTELGKGPGPFSMAWWARGIHLLSQGLREDAEKAFEESLRFAREAATARGASTASDSTGDWAVLLGDGYLALARRTRQAAGARDAWSSCLLALEAGAAAREGDAEDLRFCTAQLVAAERKLRSRGILND